MKNSKFILIHSNLVYVLHSHMHTYSSNELTKTHKRQNCCFDKIKADGFLMIDEAGFNLCMDILMKSTEKGTDQTF